MAAPPQGGQDPAYRATLTFLGGPGSWGATIPSDPSHRGLHGVFHKIWWLGLAGWPCRGQNQPTLEFVWVVPRSALFPTFTPHGLLALEPAVLEERFLRPAREHGFFAERRWAETHPEYKQPIPYVAVQRGGELLCLTRLGAQGEKRLHGKRSIGVGGHVNPCDAPDAAAAGGGAEAGDELFARACHRELHEELILPPGPLALRPVGLLNDETTPVGAVHVGLVYALDASGCEVAIRETSAMSGGFEPLSALRRLAEASDSPFETWSALLLRSGALHAGASLTHLQR